MSLYNLQLGHQLQAVQWIFVDRWEIQSSSTKNTDSCQALVEIIHWWLIMFCLNELLQVTTRSSAASNLSTVERCSFFIHKMSWQLSSSFEFYLLMTEHVSFEWDFTNYTQVFSCKQFGEFLSTDKCLFFIPHKISRQLSSTFECVDWWLLMSCLDEVIQAATRSWLQAIWWHWLTDELCLPSCKNGPQALCVHMWRPQYCLCPYREWPMLDVYANAEAEGWLAGCCPQSVGRCPEACGVI